MLNNSSFSFFSDPSDFVKFLPLIPFVITGISLLRFWINQHGGKKIVLPLVMVGGLISSGGVLSSFSLASTVEMFQFTGFIIPYVQPNLIPVTHLPVQEGIIFGNFTSFFTTTCIIGVLTLISGIFGLKKLSKKFKRDYSFYA